MSETACCAKHYSAVDVRIAQTNPSTSCGWYVFVYIAIVRMTLLNDALHILASLSAIPNAMHV